MEFIIGAALLIIFYYLFKFVSELDGKPKRDTGARNLGFVPIADRYATLEEVQTGLRTAGLESSNLILGIDFTKSNEWTGTRTFGGKCLHHLSNQMNPYQQVISVVGRTLESFDDDKLIPAFGFGDSTTKDRRVFPFFAERPCHTFQEVLSRYSQITPTISLAGPTSFAPIIYQAINICKEEKSYHILVIIADGQVVNEKETIDAIVTATEYPLSIVLIGVGDGPFDTMEEFDDGLPLRKFDNFQFVNFQKILEQGKANFDVNFAVAALQEIPEQYKTIQRLRYL